MSAATHKRPVIIGVTGGSGSGKTSVLARNFRFFERSFAFDDSRRFIL